MSAIFIYNMLYKFVPLNQTLHNHLFLEMIGSITSRVINSTFTSSRGVDKNPQFWAQFFLASFSAFRRYFLKEKKKFLSDVQRLKRVDIANPKRCPGEDLTFIDACGLSDDSKTGMEGKALSLGNCHS